MKMKKNAFWGGFPCMKCGYCCKKATCTIGVQYGAKKTYCKFLIGTAPGHYRCSLITKKIHPEIKKHLGIGEGCYEPTNTDRRLVIERGEK